MKPLELVSVDKDKAYLVIGDVQTCTMDKQDAWDILGFINELEKQNIELRLKLAKLAAQIKLLNITIA